MIFRSHHQVPEAQTCPTITALLQEWVTINQSVEFTRQVPNLGPLFATCTTPGDVVDLLDQTSYPHLDELLHSLVKTGSYLAHRILLQAFLPKLLKKALKRAWLPNSGELDDHLQDCISDFWQICANYPDTWNGHVVHHLTHTPYVPQRSITRTVPLDGQAHDLPQTEPTEDPGQTLTDLFTIALTSGLATTEDLELLCATYLEKNTSNVVAEQFGLTPAAVRKRCQRTKERLATITI